MTTKIETKLVMFDFDGVLAHTTLICYQIHKNVNPDLTWKTFKSFSRGNFAENLHKASNEKKHVIPKDFYKKYECGISALSLNEILRDAIATLTLKYNLAIISSTHTQYIKKFLVKENVLDYFVKILGADIHTSKVVKISSLLKQTNTSPHN